MIVKSAEGDRYLDRLPGKVVAVLLYGPDQGLVSERAERLVHSIVPDIRDPFRVSEFEGADLVEDRARLASEAAALSLTGGRRVVRIRSAGNASAPVFEAFLEHPAGDALIVAEAGDLAKSSSLRQVFDEASNAAAVACYADSADGVAHLLERALREHGIKVSSDAVDEAVPLLGGDRGTIRRQIEKLVLYAGDAGRVEVADVRAIIGDESEARIEEVCDAAGEGDPRMLDKALERLWSAGVSPVGVLRLAIAHFHRIGVMTAAIAGDESVDAVLRRQRPPIHFARTTSFRNQLRAWNPDKLGEALDRLLEAEVLCKSTAAPAEAACGQALFNIAALARLRA